jgi:hypothetical protein
VPVQTFGRISKAVIQNYFSKKIKIGIWSRLFFGRIDDQCVVHDSTENE